MQNDLRTKALFVLSNEGFDECAAEVRKLFNAADANQVPVDLNHKLINEAINFLYGESFDEPAEEVKAVFKSFEKPATPRP